MAAEGGGSEIESSQNDVDKDNSNENHRPVSGEPDSDRTLTKQTPDDGPDDAVPAKDDPEENETRLCGWLNKCGNIGFVKTAKLLWFVFSDDTCKLYFYRNPQDLLPLGEIDIRHASFYFDASNQRPGLFEIRSEGKVYYLDAQGQHRMTFWLEELQKKRRQYSHQRKIISSEKITWTLKNQRKGSGLTGHGKGTAVQPDDEGKDSSDGGSPKDDLVEMRSPSDSQSANTRLGQWSLFNLRSEIRDAVSNIRTQISPSKCLLFRVHMSIS
ncbi:hypothetical protein V1264_023598 [Littorina saxatilis]|uniref:PH domain-containing protein n=1 Tax=Littorina saxatilis TaxID=31220 RepID=A0AAN9B9V9_9CAEN